jgi:hypothetical protein
MAPEYVEKWQPIHGMGADASKLCKVLAGRHLDLANA